MAYCLKITKKGEARYAQIVETFYDPTTKRSTSRSVESFGDLNKQLACDPEFENKLRQRIVMLNDDDSILTPTKLDKYNNNSESIFGVFTQPKLADGLQPLNYGLAIERALWEELDLRATLERLQTSSRPVFPYDLDLLTFFIMELKFNPLGLPARSIEYRYKTILNFDNITAEQLIATIAFVGKCKDTILCQVRNQFILFDQAAHNALLASKQDKISAQSNTSGETSHSGGLDTSGLDNLAPSKVATKSQDGISCSSNQEVNSSKLEANRLRDDVITKALEQALGQEGLERRIEARKFAEQQHMRSQDRLCLQALFGRNTPEQSSDLIRNLANGKTSSIFSSEELNNADAFNESSSGLAHAVAQAVKGLKHQTANQQSNNEEDLAKVDLKSIRPFIGDTGMYDLRSIYIECHAGSKERQQMILGVLMTTEGIPLDYDFLFFGKPNHFRPQSNLKQIVDSLNRFCKIFKWQRVVIRVDHTYNLTLLLIALTELHCEYVLCQSAEALPEAIRHQILSSHAWQSLKKLPPQEGSLAAELLDPFEKWDDDVLVNFDSLISSGKFGNFSSFNCPNKFNKDECPTLAQGKSTCQCCHSIHKHKKDQPLDKDQVKSNSELLSTNSKIAKVNIPEEKISPKELLKQQQAVAPDFKYQLFKLAAKSHELCPVGIALWSQKRTNAERYMWTLAQAMEIQPQKMNIAGFNDPKALQLRFDAFLRLLGNYNATPPIDFDLLKKLEGSYLAGEKLDDTELHLLEQLQTNFLSGTMFFVTSKVLDPEETVALSSLIAETERYTLMFYRKLLTPWRWELLRKISKQPDKIPPSEVRHYQGQVMISFLAWMMEQWRSFRLFNMNLNCSVQDLQRSLDLLNVVRWSDNHVNHWLKLNVERLAKSNLSKDEIKQVFDCFNLTLPDVAESDESLKSKLHLQDKLIGCDE